MKILRLEAENVKRLQAVRIQPNGKSVVIGGANGVGKTSVLDAIQMAFGGKRETPDEPVRKGAKRAMVIAETEELTVTRRWRSTGASAVEVKAKDGTTLKSPQSVLKKLYDSLTFDPLAFERMDDRAQAETLRRLAGLDFAEHDDLRKRAYDKRTDVGRERTRLRGAMEKQAPVPAGTPGEEVSVADLVAELRKRQALNAENQRARDGLAHVREQRDDAFRVVADIEAQLEEAQATLNSLEGRLQTGEKHVAGLVDADTSGIEEQVSSAEATNRAVRAAQARAQLAGELVAVEGEYKDLSEEIERLDDHKAEAIASAEFPIEGLEVTEAGVRLAGVPFAQGSQAERLRASVAIGAASSPELRVMLVRDGALLDEKSMALLAAIAEENDMQVFVEVVGDRKEVTVLIDDGEVARDDVSTPPTPEGPEPQAPTAPLS